MTAAPTVSVLAGPFERVLTEEVLTVPASQVVLAVTGARSRKVTLDGRSMWLSGGATGFLSMDLVRSTGFHRLTVDGHPFWFATQDGKLGLEGLARMLEELRTLGTGWTGQAMFSDGSGIRDPHVSYGWLDQWAGDALAAAAAVIDNPRSHSSVTRVTRRRGGPGVLLAPTLRLLRSDPQRNLTEVESGSLIVDGLHVEPLRVVARRRTTTLDTPANRRAVAILHWIRLLAEDVIAAGADANAITRCRLWANRARTLQGRPLALALNAITVSTESRTSEETTDAPYRETYRIAKDLLERFGWSAGVQPASRLSYVQQSDVIYQAYAASRIAAELGLTQVGPVLGAAQPAFSGPDFDLYYDCRPPAAVLRSWRHHSAAPDDSRPDLLLHERATGRVAVIDAKYRQSRDGGASEDSRKDVSAYMSLYGVSTVTIAYPGRSDGPAVVAGRGQSIIEAPISPSCVDVSESIKAITASLQIAPY